MPFTQRDIKKVLTPISYCELTPSESQNLALYEQEQSNLKTASAQSQPSRTPEAHTSLPEQLREQIEGVR